MEFDFLLVEKLQCLGVSLEGEIFLNQRIDLMLWNFFLFYFVFDLLLRFDSEVEEVKAEFIQAEPKLYLFSLVTQTNSRIKLIPSERNFDTILEN